MYIHAYYNKPYAEFEKVAHPFGNTIGFDQSDGTCILTLLHGAQHHVEALMGIEGMTVLPPHTSTKPLSDDHITKFAKHGAKKGDTSKDVLDKLAAKYNARHFFTDNYYF